MTIVSLKIIIPGLARNLKKAVYNQCRQPFYY